MAQNIPASTKKTRESLPFYIHLSPYSPQNAPAWVASPGMCDVRRVATVNHVATDQLASIKDRAPTLRRSYMRTFF
ncbi:hypothetical protein FN846DRAFT_904486 [Sphaerosporella brunnea]|uniref:Uncharacterized protein n=1 Tax=Sphaerosporella brunnea TaxID=1250544 RepID=A0A5J5F417_9PEZI|nr:hypothetical protein FN846DRAFT_904486 [Sphaerosporella brunnea]